jgi:two-component system, OmpR family, sensor histidine kinase KdpD
MQNDPFVDTSEDESFVTAHDPASDSLSFLWAIPPSAAAVRHLPRDGRPIGLKPLDTASPVPDNPSLLTAPDELLAATAHELRLPLSHIKGFVSSLRRNDVEWDEATRREFLAEIEIETDRLTQLVEQLLDGAAPGRMADVQTAAGRTAINPKALVEGGLHRVRGMLGDHVVRAHMPAWLPDVRVNPDAIERVLANLLQNAAKYSPPGGLITISARLVDFDALELALDDEGPGVPVEEREHIFEPFFRSQPMVPGHGLGLAICQAIVQEHGGRIRVGDAPGGGARFSILLPVELASRGSP